MSDSMNNEEFTNDQMRRAERAFREGLADEAASAHIPDLNAGLAAIMGQAAAVAPSTPPTGDTPPSPIVLTNRNDPSRPASARKDSTGPASRTPRTAHRRRWVAIGASLVAIVALAFAIPLAYNGLRPDQPAVPAGTPTNTNTSTPRALSKDELKALLLTGSELPEGYTKESLTAMDQRTDTGDSEGDPTSMDQACALGTTDYAFRNYMRELREKAGPDQTIPGAFGTYSSDSSTIEEDLWTDPDQGIYTALMDMVTTCSAAPQTNDGTTVAWSIVTPTPDTNPFAGPQGPAIPELTYVTVISQSGLDSDPGMLIYYAVGHANGVTMLGFASNDESTYTGTDFYNNAYAKMSGGTVPATKAPAGPATNTDTPATAPAKSATCPQGINPPTGVTKAVCGGAPADAIPAPTGKDEIYPQSFRTPSGNIVCALNQPGKNGVDELVPNSIACDIKQYDFSVSTTVPQDRREECTLGTGLLAFSGEMMYLGDTAEKGRCVTENDTGISQNDQNFPTVDYETTIVGGKIACTSAEDGLTCWNTQTHHGFKLSRSAQLVW